VFSIEPLQGTIWPNSYAEVMIKFHPDLSVPVEKTVFCQVSGRETRLPLCLKGEGVGPRARFSYDVLDVEDVFVNTLHRYQVWKVDSN
jgi:hydrocephalus-inducing protein